jgi:16S rRNA (guanine966-N2)-methyltransferase
LSRKIFIPLYVEDLMRITSGTYCGRVIRAPPGAAVRPTSDKLRAAIFGILTPGGVQGAVVLDAFAGSGALALEVLSRGARGAGDFNFSYIL